MSGRLPREIDPVRLADGGIRLRGELPGSEMVRLHEALADGQVTQPVTVDLRFESSAQGERLMRGVIATEATTTCQRCLGPVRIALTARPAVVLRRPAGAPDEVAEDSEVLVVAGPLSLSTLVEDELLLALPMFPVHGEGECTAPGAAVPDRPGARRDPKPRGGSRK